MAARVATEADLDAIAETLARAFEDDLAWGWAFEEEGPAAAEHKLAALRAVFRFSAAAALGYGWVRVTDGVEAVALWVPPGEPEMSPAEAERFPTVIRASAGGEATAERLLRVMEGFDRDHPAEPPHYFLSVLGTHPDHAGHGLGLGLLSENLAEIDAAGGAPAFLETSKPHNVGLYERFGFEVERQTEVLPGIPSTHMWRQPR
jgi:ribosomal protein S18 acetylase RimI-like enzyme